MSNYDTGLVKCVYCGNYHTYSAEMCKDMMNRPAPTVVENIKYPNGDTLAPLYRYTEAEVRERERRAFMAGWTERGNHGAMVTEGG